MDIVRLFELFGLDTTGEQAIVAFASTAAILAILGLIIFHYLASRGMIEDGTLVRLRLTVKTSPITRHFDKAA